MLAENRGAPTDPRQAGGGQPGTLQADSAGAAGAEMVRKVIGKLYKDDSRRVFATLVRLLGDFDAAEDALQEAFVAAAGTWPEAGVPSNPISWLISAGRFRGIDAIRRRTTLESKLPMIDAALPVVEDPAVRILEPVADDQLRLIFTCCHPALPVEARIALTLREVCGLTTDEIARAFLSKPATLAQRIVRAKAKIREQRIAYDVPEPEELPNRLDAVLHIVYLVFNEGYAATSGESLVRIDLSTEAIRLGRLIVELMPEPEALGLLALMLLHESRRAARTDAMGDLVLLDDQNRMLWNRDQIAEGVDLVGRAITRGPIGTYTVQAAIAAEHAVAVDPANTNWRRISGLYDILLKINPSPLVELNRAVAVAMRDGPATGLDLVNALVDRGELTEFHLTHSVRGDFLRKLGRRDDARAAYRRALELALQEPERRFLQRRLDEL
ncbi:RNA polymerase sigma factor [Salinispira pacifica]